MSGMTHGKIDCLGAMTHYELSGTGTKRVLLLHGWGCDTSAMTGVCAGLSDAAQVLSIDFPGHGQSADPPATWGVPEYAAALDSLLEALSFTPCDVIAHSFGARVAIFLASERPERFRRMVLTGAAGLRAEKSATVSKNTAHFKQLKQLTTVMRKAKPLTGLADALEEAGVQRYGSEDYKKLSPEMRKTFNQVISLDLRDCLPRIGQPTLLIWGANDTATPLWMGQEMEKLIPDAGLVVFENTGHFAYAEQSERFRLIVRQFLLED